LDHLAWEQQLAGAGNSGGFDFTIARDTPEARIDFSKML
jgi:hypothetical protein